jgi:hypothetical protein
VYISGTLKRYFIYTYGIIWLKHSKKGGIIVELEIGTKKVSRFKSKMFWMKVIGVLVVLSIFHGIGASGAKVELNDKKVTLEELTAAIESKEKEVKDIQAKLDDINTQYKEKESEFTEALEVVNNKKTIEGEISELKYQVDKRKMEITTLDETLKTKNTELASVEGKIKEKKEAPKTLSAGTFTVGVDIPSGRYKAVPNGGTGNFFVNSGAKVNTILGKGGFGEPEYIFNADDGDVIEITTSVKFIPVE